MKNIIYLILGYNKERKVNKSIFLKQFFKCHIRFFRSKMLSYVPLPIGFSLKIFIEKNYRNQGIFKWLTYGLLLFPQLPVGLQASPSVYLSKVKGKPDEQNTVSTPLAAPSISYPGVLTLLINTLLIPVTPKKIIHPTKASQ